MRLIIFLISVFPTILIAQNHQIGGVGNGGNSNIVLSSDGDSLTVNSESVRTNKVITVARTTDITASISDATGTIIIVQENRHGIASGAKYIIKDSSMFPTDDVGVVATKDGKVAEMVLPVTGNYPAEWFNITTGGIDNSDDIDKAIAFIGRGFITGFSSTGELVFPLEQRGGKLLFGLGSYLFTRTILMPSGFGLKGVSRSNTQLKFTPDTPSNFIEQDVSQQYATNRDDYVSIEGFNIVGDADTIGPINDDNAQTAISLIGSYGKIKDVSINRFNLGLDFQFNGVSSYYNIVEDCEFQHVRKIAILGSQTAVTTFRNVIAVGTAKFQDELDDYAITAATGGSYMNCSFEGSSWPIGFLWAQNGRAAQFGGREEGSEAGKSYMTVNGIGRNNPVDISIDNGFTGMTMTIDSVSKAPTLADINIDQNSVGKPIRLNLGNPTQLRKVKNPSWQYGSSGWSVSGTQGHVQYIEGREEMICGQYAARVTALNQGTTNGIVLQQPVNARSPHLNFTVWIASSENAVIRAEISNIQASDAPAGSSFKSFTPTANIFLANGEEWRLYNCRIPHYENRDDATIPQLVFGLKSSTPDGEWIKFTNVRSYSGGYSVFTGVDDYKFEFLSDIPTQGYPEVGDRWVYDGSGTGSLTDMKVCLFRHDTELSASAANGDTDILITDATGVQVGDVIGVQQDGTQLWTTVSVVTGSTITLNNSLTADATAGNKVVFWRSN